MITHTLKMSFKRNVISLILTCICSNQIMASETDRKINSMECKVVDSITRSFEVGDGELKNFSWMGNPKKESIINIDFKIVANGCMVVSYNYLPLIQLSHMIDFENIEVQEQKNWIRSSDAYTKTNELTIYRGGIRIKSNHTRSSLEIRKRTTRNWNGHILADMSESDYNSLQLISLTCNLAESWDYLMEFIINKKNCTN